ncbi:MAG TPA: hypothetical protein VJY62_18915 [Bacteroidia bacterium]|nr:hypothetical protein [Bacteroidia bacterium]
MKLYQISLLAVASLFVFTSNSSCNDTDKNNSVNQNNDGTLPASVSPLQNETASGSLTKKDYCGIYVAGDWDKPVEEHVLKNPDVDGIIIRIHWKKIQLGQTKFDWTQLDNDTKAAVQAGKKFWITFAAGRHSPEWIYNHGIRKLTFMEAPQQGKLGKVARMHVPVVWDKDYIELWENFITKVADHLKADPKIWNELTMVKVSGINQKSDEIRLPAQNELKTTKGERSSNAASIWKDAGYRPALVYKVWQRVLDSYAKNFPGKILSMAIIPGHGFPTIDKNGNIVDKKQAQDFTEELIDYGLNKYKGVFAVQYNSLQEKGGVPGLTQVAQAGKRGAITGYQLEYVQLGEPSCLTNQSPCDEEMFKRVLDNGINNGACWIEIFQRNVLAFPKAISYGHTKLMK